MERKVRLVEVKNPLNRIDRDIKWINVENKTVLDIKNELFPENDVIISINGKIIDEDKWDKTYPVVGDELVIVPKVAGGGHHGKGGIVGALVAIVTTLVGFAIPVIFPSMPWLLQGLLTIGVKLLGGMLVSALTPNVDVSPKETNKPDESPTYSWTPQTTQREGIPVPVIYGDMKFYGNVIDAYLENQGDKQYLNVLLSLGKGTIVGVRDIKINDQPYYNYHNCYIQIRKGLLNQSPISYFNNTKVEYPKQIEITHSSPAYMTTVNNDFDALEVDVTFPRGIWHVDDDDGDWENHSIKISVKIRRVGTSDWIDITAQYGEIYQPVYESDVWSFGNWDGDKWIQYFTDGYDISNPPFDTSSYVICEGETVTSSDYMVVNGYYGYWRWIEHETVYVDTGQTGEIADYVTITACKTSPIRRTFVARNLPHGQYEVQVIKRSGDYDERYYGDKVFVTALREVYYDDFEYPTIALVGIRALATNQLSGSFKFECIVRGRYVRVWDGSTWRTQWTTNPAWICYDILTQPVFDNNLNVLEYEGIDPSKIDLQSFKEWADYCDELVPDGKGGYEKRCEFNGVFDFVTNLWEAVLRVCEIGRASLIWTGTKLKAIVDKPSTPVQLFSVGNIVENSFREIFLPMKDRISELEISYIDREKNWTKSVVTIVDDEIETGNKATIDGFGIVKQSQAIRHGLYKLYQNKYIRKTVEFEADIDAIACTVGDVILVQHDVPQWGYGGRIESATSTTVTLDRKVPMDSDKTYSIMIRLQDGTIVERQVVTPETSGEYQTLTVSTPFDTIPNQYDVYTFGEVDKEAKPFRIIEISKSQEQRVKITAIEYNESIYNCDSLERATLVEPITAIEILPLVENLRLNEVLLKFTGSGFVSVIDVYFDIPNSPLFDRANIYLDSGNGATLVGSAKEGHFRIGNITKDQEFTVYVTTVNIFGQESNVYSSPHETIHVVGKAAPPADVQGFEARQTQRGVKLTWQHNEDIDLWGYEIRMGERWETGIVIASIITENHYTVEPLPDGTYRFMIKAVDSSGNYSIYPATVDITIEGVNEYINVVIDTDELTTDPIANGIKTNLILVSPEISGAPQTKLTCYHMLTDQDVPNWTNQTSQIINYDGSIVYNVSYETNTIDTGIIDRMNFTLFTTIDSNDLSATNISYPNRTNLTYPNDTNEHITFPVDINIYYSTSNDNLTWSDWKEFNGISVANGRFFKFKVSYSWETPTGILSIFSIRYTIDVPDKELIIKNLYVPTSGITITYSDYGKTFLTSPYVGVTVVGNEVKIPIVSNKTTTSFDLKLVDYNNNSVDGYVDISVLGY